jgi:hypothetical protein
MNPSKIPKKILNAKTGSPVDAMGNKLKVKSLILAQNERWRRG